MDWDCDVVVETAIVRTFCLENLFLEWVIIECILGGEGGHKKVENYKMHVIEQVRIKKMIDSEEMDNYEVVGQYVCELVLMMMTM